MKWTDESDRAPEPVDLDAWRAEAGACAPLDAAATKAPWRSTWGDDEGADAERGKRGEEVTIEAVGLEGLARIVLGVTWYDGPHPCCREEDAAFIEAARDGWPRDAARVGVLCERVRALEAALLGVAEFIQPPLGSPLSADELTAVRNKVDELRAVLTPWKAGNR